MITDLSAMYLICYDCFVVISKNEILDMQMSHRQLVLFVTYANCNDGLLQQKKEMMDTQISTHIFQCVTDN